ncbi:MAG TPA: hypothetical protein DCZ10_11345 [Pelotomaculum sp.]|jgi:hypothetical protein|nr:hypothetical protein [Pelotomaculum sp.]
MVSDETFSKLAEECSQLTATNEVMLSALKIASGYLRTMRMLTGYDTSEVVEVISKAINLAEGRQD